MSIEVLDPAASTIYLGRALSLTAPHDVELEHRISKAWAKFPVFKQGLTDKNVPLHLRLKLFNAILTPSVLYGCGSWVMTSARKAQLRSMQMQMLRKILGRKRITTEPGGDIETWVEWVQRVTTEVRQVMRTHGVSDWVEERCLRMKRWSCKVKDMNSDLWAKRVLYWSPAGCRSRGHPRTRWADQLKALSLSPEGA